MSRHRPLFPDRLRDSNHSLNTLLAPHGMTVQQYKVAKSLIVSVSIIAFSAWLVTQGIDPGEVFWPTVMLLALINGVELPELIAAYTEVAVGDDSTGDNNNDNGGTE